MNRGGSLALLATVALAGASFGCSSTSSCGRDEDHIEVYGYVNADGTAFTSVEPTVDPQNPAQHTYFPANRIVTFHVGLIADPTTIDVYLSFSPDGDATIAPGAGNQSLIRARNKDTIVLRNDTCSEFWVWLTASASATPFHQVTDGGAVGGASGSDPSDTAGASGAP